MTCVLVKRWRSSTYFSVSACSRATCLSRIALVYSGGKPTLTIENPVIWIASGMRAERLLRAVTVLRAFAQEVVDRVAAGHALDGIIEARLNNALLELLKRAELDIEVLDVVALDQPVDRYRHREFERVLRSGFHLHREGALAHFHLFDRIGIGHFDVQAGVDDVDDIAEALDDTDMAGIDSVDPQPNPKQHGNGEDREYDRADAERGNLRRRYWKAWRGLRVHGVALSE